MLQVRSVAYHRPDRVPTDIIVSESLSPRLALLARFSLLVAATLAPIIAAAADGPQPIRIGSRRELFVEPSLIDDIDHAELRLHHPVPREVALVHDAPWEGTGSGYHSVFRDGDRYRMYYKAWHLDVRRGKLDSGRHPLYCCYAESRDGIHWVKPKLGIHEFRGSKDNNIVITSGKRGGVVVDAGHPAVFRDDNPAAPPDARYKAIVRSAGKNGLLVLKSPDGLHWSLLTPTPILQRMGAFDSQNLAFWDPTIGKYRAYWRYFTSGVTNETKWQPKGVRAIRTATSADLLTWDKPRDLTYVDSPPEHLYTNQVKPYYRAPHILIGFPTRYVDRGWKRSTKQLPQLPERELRASASRRYGTAITEGLLMASRDGVRFHRYNEAFLRPGIERPGTWMYGQNYIAWHVVETRSSLPGAPPELSLYATENYWHGKGTVLRRYTLRLDGFVSLHTGSGTGQVRTIPLRFDGDRLSINVSTSAAGSLRIGLETIDGKPYPGYALEDCDIVFGDSLDRTVTWKGQADVRPLAGKPVRLHIELRDADLYAFQFQPTAKEPAPAVSAADRHGAPGRHAAAPDNGPAQDPPPARSAISTATARARLLHDVFESTLHVVHHHYFRRDRATVPARALHEVFDELARRQGIEARWIAVNTRAMSVDHKPHDAFEKKAAKVLAEDSAEYSEVERGKLRYASRISLNGRGCISCHVGLRASAKKKRFAGLVLSIPIEP